MPSPSTGPEGPGTRPVPSPTAPPRHGLDAWLPGGWRKRPPLLTADLVATDVAAMDAADAPAWVRVVRAFIVVQAVLFVLAALFALVFARPLLMAMRVMTNPASLLARGGPSAASRILAGFGLGSLAGRFANRRNAREVCVWELVDAQSRTTRVRIALPVGHGFDLRGGDEVDVWGRRHRDGTVRVYHARNRRTQEALEPSYLGAPAWILFAVTTAVVMTALI
ncbi:MAG: hypothetical protein ACR2NB_07280 [Solirubrobacteraceae bacterium]